MRSSFAFTLIIVLIALATSCGNPGQAGRPALQLATTTAAGGGGTTNGVVTGVVTSATDSRPLSGVTVTLGPTATTTDNAGKYAFQNVPPGTYVLSVASTGYVTLVRNITVTAEATVSQDVQLSSAATTGGTVRGTVSSMTDARVIAGAQINIGSATTTTDATGFFTLSNLPAGSSTLTASSPGFLARSYELSISSNATTTQNVLLSVAGVLTGTISNSDGVAIAAAAIRYSGGVLNETEAVTADGSGHYNAGWVPVGTYTVTVSAPGYRPKAVTAAVGTGQTTTANLVLSSGNASGPETGWMVVTLPNPQVTPDWRSYAPADCQADPAGCADDPRFWEEFDFSNFGEAIQASFAAIASEGKYRGLFVIMPLGDTSVYWSNIKLVYDAAAAQGLVFEPVLFPKRKWGKEWCYLYAKDAPSDCTVADGTTSAMAYRKTLALMAFVESLGGGCEVGSYNRPFAIWYGWREFAPGSATLLNFWQSLPNDSCHYQSAYITWLDEPFLTNGDVEQVQAHVVDDLQQPFWVNTEMYISSNLTQNNDLYGPYQTLVTGYPVAGDVVAWAQGMCSRWTSAARPERLGVWTFYDRDLSPMEQYRAYINSSMADVRTMCSY